MIIEMYNDYSILQSAGINKEVECESINYAFDKGEHVFKPVDAVYGSLISRNGAYLSLLASTVSGNGNIIPVTSFTLGDINGDGKVDVSDYIGIANHIMGNTPEGFIVKAADVNEDSVVDVSDYIGVANIILTGSIYGNANNARTFLYEEDVEQEIDPE